MKEISMSHYYFQRMYEPVDLLFNDQQVRYYVPKKGEFKVYMPSNDMLCFDKVNLMQITSQEVMDKVKKLNGE